MINLKANRIESHRIKSSNPYFSLIDKFSWKSKNIYNYGNYIIRQEFIKTSKEKENGLRENAVWIKYYELCKIVKDSEPYKDIGSTCGQQTLRVLDRNWKAFFTSIKDYGKNPSKYSGRPKMPKYLNKENGRYILILANNQFKVKDNYIYFSWKPLKVMNNIFKTKIPNTAKLMQIRFVPQNGEYKMEVVYEIGIPETNNTSSRIASIDLGVDNLMTITTNCGTDPFVINGRPLKSINQYYNKQIAQMRSELKKNNGKDWSNRMKNFTAKRNRKVDNYIHKATKQVIDFCIEHNIDTLVCGYNIGWKQNSDIGKQNNQKFTQIPYLSIVSRLAYKCENAGIIFKQTEESYTSGTSFLDEELPIEANYNKSRRVHRGLFVSNNGTEINADVNGSYQIMKKVFPNAFADGIEGVGLHPLRVNLV